MGTDGHYMAHMRHATVKIVHDFINHYFFNNLTKVEIKAKVRLFLLNVAKWLFSMISVALMSHQAGVYYIEIKNYLGLW